MRVLEKTMENCERLSRQTQGIEPGISRMPVLKHRIVWQLVEPMIDSFDIHALPRTFGAAAGFSSHYTAWSAHIFSVDLFL